MNIGDQEVNISFKKFFKVYLVFKTNASRSNFTINITYLNIYGIINDKMVDNNVWLNQEQLVNLYNSSKSNISEHIKHILEEHELEENSVVRNFRTTAKDGKT